MTPMSQAATQDAREWELSDEDLSRAPAVAGSWWPSPDPDDVVSGN